MTMKSIVILDFGGQYAHLIARRVREAGAFSEIREAGTPADELKDVAGLILSGGPASVSDSDAPKGDSKILELDVPILGICYGHQWMTQELGGKVKPGKTKEYGKVEVEIQADEPAHSVSGGTLLNIGYPSFPVWMSHGDEVIEMPKDFWCTASSGDCGIAAMEDTEKRIYGLQFHPEVKHTTGGDKIIEYFVRECDAERWSVEDYEKSITEEIEKQVGDRKVFMLVSGGVDSTVAFTLLDKVIGADRVQGLLVDTGLMRKNEVKNTKEALAKIGFDNLHVEDASELFFERLDGVYEPERKREIIGNAFLEVQAEVAKELKLDGPEWLLGQGTIYPDTIETGGTKHSDKIKTHHNRVEEVQKMIEAGRVIEPLKDLYKDEVRELGEILGLPHDLVWRHPFPGPGLGVRILCADEADVGRKTSDIGSLLPIKSVGVQGDGRTYRHALAVFSDNPCEVTEELWKQSADIPNKNQEINRVLKCTSHAEPVEYKFTPGFINRERADLLREADNIVYEEMHSANLYEGIWQFPVVLLPFGASEGQQSIVLRPIESIDAMTANSAHLPEKVLKQMTDRILSLDGIDVVFYDLTSKPPGTIEWE